MEAIVLVIGGGNPELYGNGFLDIGNHPNSKYGIGKDWKSIDFWKELDIVLNNKKFYAIIFDNGSESWLYDISDEVFNYIMLIIIKHIYEEGFILTIGYRIVSSGYNTTILNKLLDIGFNNLGILRFGPVINDDIFNILSPGNADIIDKTDIYPPDTDIGLWNQRGYIEENPLFRSVIENNQIDFIKTRLFNNFF